MNGGQRPNDGTGTAVVGAIADKLLAAYGSASLIEPPTESSQGFDSETAYAVLGEIAERRRREGWVGVGRKIGFTNRRIWPIYNVSAPMWAHMWDRTVHLAGDAPSQLARSSFAQPRIEPEVVFKLSSPVATSDTAEDVLSHVEWMAAGFEIVQCHFRDWRFTLADATADFGVHGALIVGPARPVAGSNLGRLASDLAAFEVRLLCDGVVVDSGRGESVLGSPALALAHLARVVGGQKSEALHEGEIITTGTITDAQPVSAGETWTADFGSLGLTVPQVAFT
jgi:2-oxo-3-hexenedioate decarboxylase